MHILHLPSLTQHYVCEISLHYDFTAFNSHRNTKRWVKKIFTTCYEGKEPKRLKDLSKVMLTNNLSVSGTWVFPGGSSGEVPACRCRRLRQGMWVQSLGQEDPLD